MLQPTVLIACERSGRVRDAFLQLGIAATSCDLEPSESPGPHIQADARTLFSHRWRLIIAHPPCTYLSRLNAPLIARDPSRAQKRQEALALFTQFLIAPADMLCVENPVGFAWTIRPPDQSIEPYHFGDPFRKRTCLWLRNLPKLQTTPTLFTHVSTKPLAAPDPTPGPTGILRHFTELCSGDSNKRSTTFPGIANAMAEQWAPLL